MALLRSRAFSVLFLGATSAWQLNQPVIARSFRTTAPLAAAYYETIDGVKYDSEALAAARKAVAGEGDGRVSVADSEAILAELIDGGGVTATEFRTAFYILGNFKFTDAARAKFIDSLSVADTR